LWANEVFRGSESAKRAQNQTPVWCESLRLNEDHLKMWLSNDDNPLEDKLSLQQIHLLESRIAKPETPLGVEAYARC
jgi:hypothetical protein